MNMISRATILLLFLVLNNPAWADEDLEQLRFAERIALLDFGGGGTRGNLHELLELARTPKERIVDSLHLCFERGAAHEVEDKVVRLNLGLLIKLKLVIPDTKLRFDEYSLNKHYDAGRFVLSSKRDHFIVRGSWPLVFDGREFFAMDPEFSKPWASTGSWSKDRFIGTCIEYLGTYEERKLCFLYPAGWNSARFPSYESLVIETSGILMERLRGLDAERRSAVLDTYFKESRRGGPPRVDFYGLRAALAEASR